MNKVRLLLPILVILLLPACGFQLRGSGVDATISEAVYIVADSRAQVSREVRAALKNSGANLVENRANADILLTIIREETGRRTLSVGSDTRIRDIGLDYAVWFSIQRASSDEAAPENELRVRREYNYDSTGVLGNSDEEAVLYNEMRRELARRILQRLAAFSA